MSNQQIPSDTSTPAVTVGDGFVIVNELVLEDPVVVEHLEALSADERAAEVAKALAIGVRGLVTMTAGASVQAIGSEVERALAAVTDEAEARVQAVLEAGGETLRSELDPGRRSSLAARTIEEVIQAHRRLLDELDPDARDSRVGQLMDGLGALLGPDGMLAQRLNETFDVSARDSSMAQVVTAMERRFQEIRDLMVGESERSREAERGTAKGVAFEDTVEAQLRDEARRFGGCVVERTGRTPGKLGVESVVGDLTVTLGSGTTVAVEVKNMARIALTGSSGILAELDRAMVNREARWGICVSRTAAYPDEVGGFGIYGNRILLADDDDGTLLRVALRWIVAAEASTAHDASGVDREALLGRLDRIQELAGHFGRTKRALTTVRRGVDDIKTEIDDLRTQLLDLVADARIVVTTPDDPPSPIRVA